MVKLLQAWHKFPEKGSKIVSLGAQFLITYNHLDFGDMGLFWTRTSRSIQVDNFHLSELWAQLIFYRDRIGERVKLLSALGDRCPFN
jgi:hypothetical protein